MIGSKSLAERVDDLAKELANTDDQTWKPYYWESTDSGVIIKGCSTTVFKRGPRKGQTKFLIKQNHKIVVISSREIQAMK